MNKVITEIYIDLARNEQWIEVKAKQYDDAARHILVNLTDNGAPYTIPAGTTVRFQGTKPDGKQIMNDCTVANNKVDVTLTSQTLATEGTMQCEIFLADGSGELRSFSFTLRVLRAALQYPYLASKDEYQSIDKIKADTLAYKQAAETARIGAETAKTGADSSAAIATAKAQQAQLEAQKVQQIAATNEAYNKEQIDLEYAHAPRGEATGKGSIDLSDSDRGKAYVELEGASEQYQAAGTNLFDVNAMIKNMKTLKPSNIAIMRDGGKDVIQISNNGWVNSCCLEFKNDTSKEYSVSLSARLASTVLDSLQFYVKFKDGTTRALIIFANETVFTQKTATIPIGKEIDYFYFSYSNLVSYYNIEIEKCSLYLKETPSTEKPTGGYGTPSPEYPSEVQSVGEIPKDMNGVEIRNLLDEEWLRNESNFTFAGKFAYMDVTNFIPKKKLTSFSKLIGSKIGGGQAFLTSSYSNGAQTHAILLVENDGSPAISRTRDFSSDEKIYLSIFRSGATATYKDVKNILDNYNLMVTTAAEIDEYRPYIGANNGLVKLETVGKNIVDIDVYKGANSTVVIDKNKVTFASMNGILEKDILKIKPKENTQYTISFSVQQTGIVNGRIRILHTDETYVDAMFTQQSVKASSMPNKTIKKVFTTYGSTEATFSCSLWDVQLEEGTTATPYQPYQSQTTWVTLKEPLRAIGDYKDTVDREGNVEQRIGKKTYTGEAGVSWGVVQFTNLCAYTAVWGLVKMSGTTIKCNKFKDLGRVSDRPDGTIGIGVEGVNTDISGFFVGVKGIASNKEEWVAWLQKNPITVCYPLREEHYITYQIPAIHLETYDPITHARCLNKVVPSKMSLDYKQSLIKILSDLQNAVLALGGN